MDPMPMIMLIRFGGRGEPICNGARWVAVDCRGGGHRQHAIKSAQANGDFVEAKLAGNHRCTGNGNHRLFSA